MEKQYFCRMSDGVMTPIKGRCYQVTMPWCAHDVKAVIHRRQDRKTGWVVTHTETGLPLFYGNAFWEVEKKALMCDIKGADLIDAARQRFSAGIIPRYFYQDHKGALHPIRTQAYHVAHEFIVYQRDIRPFGWVVIHTASGKRIGESRATREEATRGARSILADINAAIEG